MGPRDCRTGGPLREASDLRSTRARCEPPAAPTPACVRAAYRRRQPEHTDLYRVVQENLRTFLALAEEAERPMPTHIQREFAEYLRCGILAEGFARVHCRECQFDRLVACSCRGRGWCPSCLGRRMNEGAAHLADRVFGDTPVRHWVLSLPHPLRYLLAHDGRMCGEILDGFVNSIFRWLRTRAKALLGLASVRDAYPGAKCPPGRGPPSNESRGTWR